MLTIINKIRNRKINSSSHMNTFVFLIRKNKNKSNHIDWIGVINEVETFIVDGILDFDTKFVRIGISSSNDASKHVIKLLR